MIIIPSIQTSFPPTTALNGVYPEVSAENIGCNDGGEHQCQMCGRLAFYLLVVVEAVINSTELGWAGCSRLKENIYSVPT